ncbi:hypothetical protein YM304_06250 [Ilumatobacter coccineus YM16-304]|uniref:FAS1 domain-containing protein n=1 Tax=Ilumatobacter coccineus (strain NBRC 103263 / KCTC 29153 / YM16-304) TaxID=1313172 RepID=A0A6C7E6S0_ILUCY|nr:hypothetical protein YM304_06250 [Ilumatobacter coccineus YM16-304]
MLLSASACGDDTASVDEPGVDAAVDDVTDVVDELIASLNGLGLDSAASAVASADLTDIVDAGEFTFLAPNNDAFFAVDADELADLLADPGQVERVLRNHIIASAVVADELRDGASMEAASGRMLDVTVDGNAVTIGGITVVEAEVATGASAETQGVVHIVDGLILE